MDGKRMVFPNATVHIEHKVLAYWLNPENRSRAPEEAKKYFDEARPRCSLMSMPKR
jgi:hypothetical protein